MGNSSNSVARYNLSVNDNGVLIKNMLSTNYSPTYFLNNVFVYDGDKMDWFHDEVFKDTVYLLNNVFYNTSATTPTKWFRRDNALDKAVFSNNAYYEAGGVYSDQQPEDPNAVLGDPQFVADPVNYKKNNGVANIVDSASSYKLKETSPLIDAGRYNKNVGAADFFGTHLYYGKGVDIGIQESQIGDKVDNPVDEHPIEEEGESGRVNLALNKKIEANYTHPNPGLEAGKLVDGDTSTRWASADPEDMTKGYPIVITIDFEEQTTFDEIYLDEYTDGSTNPRIQEYELQKYDDELQQWTTFKKETDGMGHDVALNDFGSVTSSKLRLLITKQKETEMWTPTMTEIQVYNNAAGTEEKNPTLNIESATYDLNESMANHENNTVTAEVYFDNDSLDAIRYIGTEGNVLSSLTEGEDYTVQEATYYNVSRNFLKGLQIGQSGLQFEFASGSSRKVNLIVVDSTELESTLDAATAIEADSSDAYLALQQAIQAAGEVLNKANRTVQGSGNSSVNQTSLDGQTASLKRAIENYNNNKESGSSVTVPGAPTGVTAVAGDGQAVVSFTPPANDGGNPIIRYDIVSSPDGITAMGTSSPITVAPLRNGTDYTFTVQAVNAAGAGQESVVSNTVTPVAVTGSVYDNNDSGGNGSTSGTTGDEVIVNGVSEQAGTLTKTTVEGRKVALFQLNATRLDELLAASGEQKGIRITMNTIADTVIGELPLTVVERLAGSKANLELATPDAAYVLPAEQINLKALASLFGQPTGQMKLRIEISKASSEMSQQIERLSADGAYTLLTTPFEFKVKVLSGDQTAEVDAFASYVERRIAISGEVNHNHVVAGIAVEPDGTFRPVPTKATEIGGVNYAVINSRSNSVYAVVSTSVNFSDTANHWAGKIIDDMGSRLIINGTDGNRFEPDRTVTREEFAALIVRGLGLQQGGSKHPFKDVTETSLFGKYLDTAYGSELVTGNDKNEFEPRERVTREQAMTIISRALKIAGVQAEVQKDKQEELLAAFADAGNSAVYSRSGIAACLNAGIISGSSGARLAPKDNLTRAEAAVLINRLLQKADLI